METRLLKLKVDFNDIITIRNNVKNVFDILRIRIDKLHQIYTEFINNNKSEMFVFGLDSFQFQSKLIDIEYDDMKRLFLAINNRMYCEYFKLHKIIVEYITKNINDKKSVDFVKIKNYPTYKDLEPFKEYKFDLVLDIHENILNLLGMSISLLNNKENELLIHKTKQNIGLNIDNFVTTFNFHINVMKEKLTMFITYIEFFHKMHTKYLKRFSNKIQLIYTHINNDIKFDDTVEVSKNKKKELISELVNGEIDQNLLKEIKTSIGSETNSENSSVDSSLTVSSSLDKISTPNHLLADLNEGILFEKNIPEKNMNIVNKFKKNVHKVKDILKLKKTIRNDEKTVSISNSELNDIFSGIDKSCDSIIDNTDNIELKIEFLDAKNKGEITSFEMDTEASCSPNTQKESLAMDEMGFTKITEQAEIMESNNDNRENSENNEIII